MSQTARMLLSEEGYSKRLQTLASVCIEDLINLICEQNRGTAARVLAEFTLIPEDDGVRVILRNDGKHFSIKEESLAGCTFLKYTIDRMLTTAEHCSYIVTAGYNCSELFFRKERGA